MVCNLFLNNQDANITILLSFYWIAFQKSVFTSTPSEKTINSLSPYAARSPGLTVGASSVGSIFSVKKGRLFERSEFLPFSWKCYRSSPGSAALSFSFGIFSFVSRQKKSTPTSIIHIKKIRIFCPFLLYIS